MTFFFFRIVCLGLVVLSRGYSANALGLAERWDREMRSPGSEILAEIREILLNRHIVLLTGSLNEISTGYFKNNIQSIKEDLHTTAKVINPSTRLGIAENARILKKKLWKEYELHQKKKLILVGHSMGGAVALYSFLTSPFIRQIVDRVILIQASVGGAFDGMLYDSCCILKTLPDYFMQGTKEQSPRESTRIFDDAFHDFTDQVFTGDFEEISNRIFYVRGFQTEDKIGYLLKWPHFCLSKIGLNDGMVLLSSQVYNKIGVPLDVLQVGHIDLTVSGFGNLGSLEQRAFTRALFSQVYSEGARF